MSCGRKQCKRTVRTSPQYCRCGMEFCSEPCFVSEWHAEHSTKCPQSAAIKADIAKKQQTSGRSGTALLVGAALKRTPPSGTSGEPMSPNPEATPSMAAPAAATTAAALSAAFSPSEALSATAPVPPRPPRDPEPAAAPPPAPRGPRRDPDAPAASQPRPRPESPATKSAPAPCDPGPATKSCPSSPARLAKPVLQRYRLEEFEIEGGSIGSGSYGSVNKVVRKGSGEVFAMKKIPKKKVLETQMTAYLFREVKIQMKMQHPSILRLYYYFEDADNVLLLLELAGMGSLFSVMKKQGCLSQPRAARVFYDTASALDFLHGHGIIHRDLKPENILMCGEDVAKLADFGWCAELTNGASRHTFCGTWDYLSPEMIQSEPHDSTVDIWAIGVLLYELLTGRPPFAASSHAKAVDRITRVDLQIPDIVAALAKDLIRRLLVRAPKKRLQLKEAMQHQWVAQYVTYHEYVAECDLSSASSANGATASARSSGAPPEKVAAPRVDEAAVRREEEEAQQRRDALQKKLADIQVQLSQLERPRPQEAAKAAPARVPEAKELAHLGSPTSARVGSSPMEKLARDIADLTIPGAVAAQQAPPESRNWTAAGPATPTPAEAAKPSVMPWGASGVQLQPVQDGATLDREVAEDPTLRVVTPNSKVAADATVPVVPRGAPSMPAAAVFGASPGAASVGSGSSVASPDPLAKSQTWAQHETFAKLRQWHKANTGCQTDLGLELDNTLSRIGAPQASTALGRSASAMVIGTADQGRSPEDLLPRAKSKAFRDKGLPWGQISEDLPVEQRTGRSLSPLGSALSAEQDVLGDLQERAEKLKFNFGGGGASAFGGGGHDLASGIAAAAAGPRRGEQLRGLVAETPRPGNGAHRAH